MPKQSPPLVNFNKRIISVCVDNATKQEQIETTDYFIRIVEKITKKRLENLMVLTFVLRELPKLKSGKVGIRFDFGTKKEWELKRIK